MDKPQSAIRNRQSPIDFLLILMAVIWGTNYSLIKFAFRELSPQAFNAVRMTIASGVFLAIIGSLRFRRWRTGDRAATGGDSLADIFQTPVAVNGRDLAELTALGLIGHFLYQYFFIGGLALTTVANSSLMLAATPVVIALLSALFGLEAIGPRHWLGAALSMLGIYIVVGQGVSFGAEGNPTLTGDLMMVAAVICWALYTLGARRLISRHSPVGVTGMSMAIGTLIYVPVMWKHVDAVPWRRVGPTTWLAVGYSAVFALCVAYTIWYAAVRQIGSARTSVYSNVIPVVAMATAVVFLGEPLSLTKVAGAASVLVGVALTRTAPQTAPHEPCEP